MQQIIIGGLMAFFVTFMVIPVIMVIADKKKLYDEPDATRKLHQQPIPSLGGLGMFVGFIFSILPTINISSDAPEFQYYIAAFLLIFFLGIKDDIMIISPVKKIIGQALAAGILVFKANLVIANMDGFLGIHELNTTVSYLFTIFSVVVIINAFNLIDGVDGLAGGLGLISTLVFGIYFLINGSIPYALLAFSFAGSLIAFLYYNLYPAKIFMGDTGSLMVGLVNSILVIKFIQAGGSYVAYPVSAAPAIGFAVLLLPLMDTLRVFTVRILTRRSPFSPDRNHIHHLLLNRGLTHKAVTFSCVIASVVISVIAFSCQKAGTGFIIAGLAILFFSFVYFINYRKTKYRFRVIKGEASSGLNENDIRLVSLYDNKAAAVDDE